MNKALKAVRIRVMVVSGGLQLDEPFGALDTRARSHLQQELERIWRAEGITAILVTHDVEEAVCLGDRVVVMAPRTGRIKRIGDAPLSRARDLGTAAFAAIRDNVLSEFHDAPTRPPVDRVPAIPRSFSDWRFST